jgi:CMP-2-keto-3-deoxyoctulosonic acid synthetase
MWAFIHATSGFMLLENKHYWIFLQFTNAIFGSIRKLEQLRYLEFGKRIKMVETTRRNGIDTPEDLEKRGACYNNFWLHYFF